MGRSTVRAELLALALAIGLQAAALPAATCRAQSDGDPMPMDGMYGRYPMSREASGTSWQPDSTPAAGVHDMSGPWMTMWHGSLDLVHDDQGGPRGDTQTFSTSMLMFMARRELDGGSAGLRLMTSADPLMGPRGYPELFQTGETADGVHPLVDRQHPHNLLMEAAVTGSKDLRDVTLFAYAGLAGEPALGPPAFMHRFSGMDAPLAPLGHHWLDSTHVTYGVVTAGVVHAGVKLDASVFNGREPDQDRYRVELRPFDSYSVRLSFNPTDDLSLQVSSGRLASPEQLAPQVAVRRSTASASYNRMRTDLQWQSTLAYGRNDDRPGTTGSAWLVETELVYADAHTVFGRAERVDKDELFLPGQPLYGRAFTIDSLSLGYVYDFAHLDRARLGVGGMLALYRYPAELDAAYGRRPVSITLFVRLRL